MDQENVYFVSESHLHNHSMTHNYVDKHQLKTILSVLDVILDVNVLEIISVCTCILTVMFSGSFVFFFSCLAPLLCFYLIYSTLNCGSAEPDGDWLKRVTRVRVG